MATYEPTPEPVPPSGENPVSPKVTAAGVIGVLGTFAIALVAAIVSWIATDDGQRFLKLLPEWAELIITILVTAAVATFAAYQARDPIRAAELARRGVPADER